MLDSNAVVYEQQEKTGLIDLTQLMLDKTNEEYEMMARCLHILSSEEEIKGDLAPEVFEELDPIEF